MFLYHHNFPTLRSGTWYRELQSSDGRLLFNTNCKDCLNFKKYYCMFLKGDVHMNTLLYKLNDQKIFQMKLQEVKETARTEITSWIWPFALTVLECGLFIVIFLNNLELSLLCKGHLYKQPLLTALICPLHTFWVIHMHFRDNYFFLCFSLFCRTVISTTL